MKVLFNCNTTGFQSAGGGEVQLLKTKEYLDKNKINVKLFDQWEDKISDYDIVHNFGKSNNCYDVIHFAKLQNVKVALTPIYNWPSIKYSLNEAGGFKNKLKLLIYLSIKNNSMFNPFSKTKLIMNESDAIFVDSNKEANLLVKHFNINDGKIKVIPVGVEKKFRNAKPDLFIDKFGLMDFVLFVGRIDRRKNLLNLIKVVNKLNLPLVIIGDKVIDQQSYYEDCRKIAKDNVHFLGKFDMDSDLLISAYSAAKVLALPSFIETPGITALEAALAGTNIVITNRGSTKDYFSNYVEYVDPLNINSIEKGIKKGFDKEKNKELSNHIGNNFIWDVVIKKIINEYKRLAL